MPKGLKMQIHLHKGLRLEPPWWLTTAVLLGGGASPSPRLLIQQCLHLKVRLRSLVRGQCEKGPQVSPGIDVQLYCSRGVRLSFQGLHDAVLQSRSAAAARLLVR